MPFATRVTSCVLFVLGTISLGGCGLFTPEKGLLSNDDVDPPNASPQGMFEQNVVSHIRCEIRNGVWKAIDLPNAMWLASYGATVELKLTVEDQSSLSPNSSFVTPFGKAGAESFTFGIGGSGTANATRAETIQFTYSNAELLSEAGWPRKHYNPETGTCQGYQHGVMIDSNLKIGQFIYDKIVVAGAAGEATSKSVTTPPFSQYQFELTFVASFGGSITPTWKFTRTSVNTSTLFSATRTDTDYVLITLGPVAQGAKGSSQPQLSADTKALHNAAVIGNATAAALSGTLP